MPTKGPLFVGIDVGKTTLDVAAGDLRLKLANDRAGHEEMLTRVRALRRHLHFIVEVDNGYGRTLILFLFARRCRVTLVNPYRVRSFARASGKLAKTDRIDAMTMHEYGQTLRPAPSAKPDQYLARLQHVMRRRRQLREALHIQKQQLPLMWDKSIARATEALVEQLSAECAKLQQRAEELVCASPVLAARYRLFQSVKCIGATTALELVAGLPELGSINRREIAALVGVAPINYDTGTSKESARIKGGRFYLRRALYMSAVAGIRFNEVLAPFYQRLRANGKPGRVAIVAAMRKLVVHLNSLAGQITRTPPHSLGG